MNIIKHLGIIDIYRILHPINADDTLFSRVYGTFTNINHILGHKISLYKFTMIQIKPNALYVHNGIKLEIIKKGVWKKLQIFVK